MKTATRKQIDYIRSLAEKAGYSGDRVANAGKEILGNMQWSRWTTAEASQVIEALKKRIAA